MVDADAVRNCGICCGGFSLFAIIFLLSVGGIIKSGSEIIDVPEASRQSAGSTCYYGALIYFVTFLLSIVCFFGPMFIRRNADLEGMRMRSDGKGRRQVRSYQPQEM